MTKVNFNRAGVLVAIALAILTTATHAEMLTGRVVRIADGDTLTLLDSEKTQHRIRLAGIDSPEKGQAFGQHCKKSLSDLAYDRVVTVESNRPLQPRYWQGVGERTGREPRTDPARLWMALQNLSERTEP